MLIMKVLMKIISIILLSYIPNVSIAQTVHLKIDSLYTEDTEISPFTDVNQISGLFINANIQLENQYSLVRIILTDSKNREYLVY